MSENNAEAFLLSVSSSMEADMIESLLKADDIPVLRKYRESGGYMMIMMGSTIYGVDLYVPCDMLDKAREIVANSREASKDADFPDNVEPEGTIGEAPGEESGADADAAEDDGAYELDGPDGEDRSAEDAAEGMPCDAAEDMAEDEAGSEVGNIDAGGNYTESEAGAVDHHEEQYRLAEEHSDRKRRGRAWMTLLFFSLLILIIAMLIKYLYGLFGV